MCLCFCKQAAASVPVWNLESNSLPSKGTIGEELLSDGLPNQIPA